MGLGSIGNARRSRMAVIAAPLPVNGTETLNECESEVWPLSLDKMIEL